MRDIQKEKNRGKKGRKKELEGELKRERERMHEGESERKQEVQMLNILLSPSLCLSRNVSETIS